MKQVASGLLIGPLLFLMTLWDLNNDLLDQRRTEDSDD